MADTMGHSATATRNTSLALGFCLLAIAPQIFEFVWSIGTIFGWGTGRGPATVVISHATALLVGAPSAILAGDSKKSSDVLLALIYSYPLFVVAILTLFMTIRSAQDYVGGIVLMALALFALWAGSDLQGMRGFSFGAGTAPRMFGGLLVALSAGIALTGLMTEGPALAHYSWRGPLFVMAAILFFALAIRPLGLVVSAFASFLIAAMGSHETRLLEAVIVGACLTLGCALLFPYVLGLPMPMFPRFLVQ
ncbi:MULTISPECIES: tripartite tricarboxylate transporter TctB family protein [unclassified Bradyrhizobium]|uniref:tripartite tricarboxylate transporter TctB family protein n=1 Tax=unclassified Bradyrhizobium TaxID=2631580 RepID=UPI00247AFA56|nr:MULTISPECIES: tripartite tricarboxylate transporter TctB family protein [unclassified Bradyrhizobium]WGR69777.1 tripartite tricarboxylate transporter TctB family protein [Bradyrhizobium sp. ISRA426]WGR81833.1 tripartite tricarboxylate transporter TctB family protein [Bradyrhizobium sp. ISRA430]WGR85019.1 tripartite tricarboxylate transporter TctB family protein [Bradyrhizobium sp. ISRA432]